MAVTSPMEAAAGAGGTQPPGWLPGAPTERGRARPAAQAAVFLACLVAVALLAMAVERAEVILPLAVALGVGIALGVGTRAGEFMSRISGLMLSVVAMVLTALAFVFIYSVAQVELPPLTIGLVGAVVLGLDWLLIGRLRGVTFASGLLVVPTVGMERGWAYPAALLWLVIAVVALWLLQADERAGLQRPLPVGYGPDEPEARGADLFGTLGAALAVGIAVAFLLGQPSCSLNPHADPPDILSGGDRPQPDLPGGGTPDSGPGSGGVPPDYRPGGDRASGTESGTGETGETGGTGGTGGETAFSIDENGDRYTTDPRTGERYDVTEENGTLVARDSTGRVVAEIDGSGMTAGDPQGDGQRYQVGEDGRYYVEGPNGERLVLDPNGGRPVLLDDEGNVVAEGGYRDGHLVIRDPDGDVVVPDPDGDGSIPIPNGGIRDALPGLDGRTTYRSNGDSWTATEEGGTTRTYDRDAQGRRRVTVETPGEDTRTYVYEEDEGANVTSILEYDDGGELVRRYRFDPDGVIVDGRPSGSGTYRGGEAGQDPSAVPDPTAEDPPAGEPEAKDDDQGGGPVWPWILGGVALLGMAVAAYWFWGRRPDTPAELAWAEDLVTRIEAHGAGHGRSRKPDETILAYTRALHDGPLPDERISWLGIVLSAALFGPAAPPPEARQDAEQTLEAVVESFPIPTRSERRRQNDSEDRAPAPLG